MTRKIPAFMLSLLPILFMSMLLGPLTFILLNRYFSWEFLRLGLWVSLIMLIGVLLNLFISRQLAGRIRILYLHGLSSLLSLGVAVSILVTVFVLKPFFLAFGAQILLSYTAILFLLICIVNLLVNSFSLYQKRAVEHEKSLYEERQMRGDMERKLHTSRVNPHFLFNSLNLMVSLLDDREKAEDILIQLADLLRYNLDAVKLERISLQEELDITRKYMAIQMERFGKRLEYHVSGDEDFPVPPMIIQPLVENSIKHNIREVDQLRVNIEVQDHCIVITDSARRLEESMAGEGTGLSITAKRMTLLGGHLKIENGGVVLCFPKT